MATQMMRHSNTSGKDEPQSRDGARGGRPLGRGLRPRRQHAGAGGDRHPRPCQFDGGGGAAFSRRLSAQHDAAGRPLHHQRSVADLRPPARSDRGQPDIFCRARRSACSPAPSMSSISAGSAWGRTGARCSRRGCRSR